MLPKRQTLSLPLHSQPHRCPASVTGVLGREGVCPHLLLKSSQASKFLARSEGRDYFQHLPATSNPSRIQTRMGGYTAVQPPSAVLRAPKLDVQSGAFMNINQGDGKAFFSLEIVLITGLPPRSTTNSRRAQGTPEPWHSSCPAGTARRGLVLPRLLQPGPGSAARHGATHAAFAPRRARKGSRVAHYP